MSERFSWKIRFRELGAVTDPLLLVMDWLSIHRIETTVAGLCGFAYDGYCVCDVCHYCFLRRRRRRRVAEENLLLVMDWLSIHRETTVAVCMGLRMILCVRRRVIIVF